MTYRELSIYIYFRDLNVTIPKEKKEMKEINEIYSYLDGECTWCIQ